MVKNHGAPEDAGQTQFKSLTALRPRLTATPNHKPATKPNEN
jgi:hypothetical protein